MQVLSTHLTLPAPTALHLHATILKLQEQRSSCPFEQEGLLAWDDPSTWGGALPSVMRRSTQHPRTLHYSRRLLLCMP